MSDQLAPASEPAPEPSFADQAAASQPGLIREFGEFLLYNKKWWLIPILVVLALLGLLVFLGNTAAPFIYPLF